VAKTIVVKDSDERAKAIIGRFNMLAAGMKISQQDLIIVALEEFTVRHWADIIPPNYIIPEET